MDDAPQDDEAKRELYQQIFDQLIRPQLKHLADKIEGFDPSDLDDAQIDITQLGVDLPEDLELTGGEALLLSSQDADRIREVMGTIQEHMQEGLSLDYILQEMCDVNVSAISSSQVGNIRVNLVAIDPEPSEVDTPSADELRDMFER